MRNRLRLIERAKQEAAAEKTRIAEQTEFEIGKIARTGGSAKSNATSKLAKLKLRRFSAEESIRLAEEKIKKEINAEKDARFDKSRHSGNRRLKLK